MSLPTGTPARVLGSGTRIARGLTVGWRELVVSTALGAGRLAGQGERPGLGVWGGGGRGEGEGERGKDRGLGLSCQFCGLE